jgi:hypothetical protein
MHTRYRDIYGRDDRLSSLIMGLLIALLATVRAVYMRTASMERAQSHPIRIPEQQTLFLFHLHHNRYSVAPNHWNYSN